MVRSRPRRFRPHPRGSRQVAREPRRRRGRMVGTRGQEGSLGFRLRLPPACRLPPAACRRLRCSHEPVDNNQRHAGPAFLARHRAARALSPKLVHSVIQPSHNAPVAPPGALRHLVFTEGRRGADRPETDGEAGGDREVDGEAGFALQLLRASRIGTEIEVLPGSRPSGFRNPAKDEEFAP